MFTKRSCKTLLEKCFCFLLVLVITPCFFIFEMTIVRPVVAQAHDMGALRHALHVATSLFLFTNIVGNMMLCVFTDTSAKTTFAPDHYCLECQMGCSAETWHCTRCNACILRRDHHCFFFARCIGLHNLRYYVLYLGYIFVSLIYSTYHNYYYVLTKFDDGDGNLYLSVCRIINPFLRYLIPEPMCLRDLYVLFLFLNMGLVVWTGALFAVHMRNVVRGVTAVEYKNCETVDYNDMKRNFKRVFGKRWYFVIMFPFVDSPTLEMKND